MSAVIIPNGDVEADQATCQVIVKSEFEHQTPYARSCDLKQLVYF